MFIRQVGSRNSAALTEPLRRWEPLGLGNEVIILIITVESSDFGFFNASHDIGDLGVWPAGCVGTGQEGRRRGQVRVATMKPGSQEVPYSLTGRGPGPQPPHMAVGSIAYHPISIVRV